MRQSPGFFSGVALNDFGPAEAEIANNLATVWFIPFAGIYRAGRTTLPYLFLKPCDSFKERFNLYNEILCLFHPYAEVDARILNSIDSIISANGARLDRLCVVLVTNADGFSKELERRQESDSDPRIVVPFKYQELKGGVAGKERLMFDHFERLLLTKDLFSMSSALKTERFFFGRSADIQKLIGHYQNNENSSVFGLRRIGKTSVLWAVVRQLKQLDVPVVFIDGNDTTFHRAAWNKALYRVKEMLFQANGLGRSGNNESQYTEADASTCFAADLKAVKTRKSKPSLVVFDEIQNLCFDISSSSDWKSGKESLPFWQAIRSVYQQNQNLFSFILAGTNAHIVEASHSPSGADNPLFGYVATYYLGFFDHEEVKGMLTHIGSYMGATFESSVYTYLTDDFGGHPFLIRQACSKLWDLQITRNVPRRVLTTKNFYIANRSTLMDHTRNYITMILQVLTERYPREFDLLRTLAAGDQERFQIYAADCRQDVEHLRGYGLIEEAQSKFYFRIAAVEMAVKESARDLMCPASIEERWAILSKERNQFEFRFRDFVRSNLKVALGKDAAKAATLSILRKSSQLSTAQNLEYDAIFTKEFYFSNLKDLVILHWDRFKFLFNEDKQRFAEAMDAANRLRADAHAKTITTEQFRAAMPLLVWLSKSFDENS